MIAEMCEPCNESGAGIISTHNKWSLPSLLPIRVTCSVLFLILLSRSSSGQKIKKESRVHITMAYANNEEVILLDSESEEFFFSEMFEDCESKKISYEDYLKKRIGLENEAGREVKKLWSKHGELLRENEMLLIRKNCIFHYTPLGAALKTTELMADQFFNSRTVTGRFREYYKTFSDEAKDYAQKLSLTIDAHKWAVLIEEQIAKKRIAVENVIDSVNKLLPCYQRPTTQTVNQDISKAIATGFNKFYDGYYCEYCNAVYNHKSALSKHEQKKHSRHFERAVYKNIDLTIKMSEPAFQRATTLMAAEIVGLQQFEILLDPELKLSKKIRIIKLKERKRQRSIARRIMKNGSQNQMEKIKNAKFLNPFPGKLSIGKNQQFLNFLKESKEQEHYPYYWVDPDNVIHCHCLGNPKAKWYEGNGCFRCAKLTKKEGKCCLYNTCPWIGEQRVSIT